MPRRRVSEETQEEIRRLAADGVSRSEIHRRTGVSFNYIIKILGVARPLHSPELEEARNVRDMNIMSLAQEGLTYKEIGRRVGISKQRAREIVNEKTKSVIRKLEPGICARQKCGKPFSANKPGQIYCSERCKQAEENARFYSRHKQQIKARVYARRYLPTMRDYYTLPEIGRAVARDQSTLARYVRGERQPQLVATQQRRQTHGGHSRWIVRKEDLARWLIACGWPKAFQRLVE